jgi:hypothetical protein
MEEENLVKQNTSIKNHVMKYYGSMFEKGEVRKPDINKTKRMKKRNFLKKKKNINPEKIENQNNSLKENSPIVEYDEDSDLDFYLTKQIDEEFKEESEKLIMKINQTLEKKYEKQFLDFIDKKEKFLELEEEEENKEKDAFFKSLNNFDNLTQSDFEKIYDKNIDMDEINLLLNKSKTVSEKKIFETFKKIDTEENLKNNKNFITKQFQYESINQAKNQPVISKFYLSGQSDEFFINNVNKIFEKNLGDKQIIYSSHENFYESEKETYFQKKNEIKEYDNKNESEQNENKKEIKENNKKEKINAKTIKESDRKNSLRSSEPFDEQELIKSDILEMAEKEFEKDLVLINEQYLFQTDEKSEKDFEDLEKMLFNKKTEKNFNSLLKKATSKKTPSFKKPDIDFDTFKKEFSFQETKELISEINKIYQKTEYKNEEEMFPEEYKTAGSLKRETYNKNPTKKNEDYLEEDIIVDEESEDVFVYVQKSADFGNNKKIFGKNKQWENIERMDFIVNDENRNDEKINQFGNLEFEKLKKIGGEDQKIEILWGQEKKPEIRKNSILKNTEEKPKISKKEILSKFNKNKNFEEYRKEVLEKNVYFSAKTDNNSKTSFVSYDYMSLSPDLISLSLDADEIFRSKLNSLVTKMMHKKASLIQKYWRYYKSKQNEKVVQELFKIFLKIRNKSQKKNFKIDHIQNELFFNEDIEKNFFLFLDRCCEKDPSFFSAVKNIQAKSRKYV